jgi:hypothetical protein
MSNHGDTERYIVNLFKTSGEFEFEGKKYKTKIVGKPRPERGECKTDIYILALDILTNQTREIKISVKQSDADFLENKMSYERAVEIFGDDTDEILTKSIFSVEQSFKDDYLVYFTGYRRTEAKCIKMGWKFELLNKHGGERSGALLMTDEQKIDVYAGSNLNNAKRNAKVGGMQIIDSGIANYILEVDKGGENLDFYLQLLLPIEEYARDQKLYFACKALNYRVIPDKWDGNRPLAVYVNWKLEDNILKAEIVFDTPLKVKGDSIGLAIRKILNSLNVDASNFEDLKKYLDKRVISAG